VIQNAFINSIYNSKQTPGLTIQQHKARGITANRYGKPGSW